MITLFAVDASAQYQPPVYAVPLASSYPRATRNIGMGGIGVASLPKFTTAHFNPASVVWTDALYATGSYHDWIIETEYADARVVAPIGGMKEWWRDGFRGGIVAAYSTERFDPGIERTIFLPGGFAVDAQTDYYITGGGAVGFKKGDFEIATGAVAKYHDAEIFDAYTAWTYDWGFILAFDVSTQDGPRMRPRAGVSVLNMGKNFQAGSREFEPDKETRYGLGVDVFAEPHAGMTRRTGRPVPSLSASVDVDFLTRTSDRSDRTLWAFGVEVSILEIVQFRAGATEGALTLGRENTLGVGVGWDAGSWLVQLDWAHVGRNVAFSDDYRRDDAFALVLGGRW